MGVTWRNTYESNYWVELQATKTCACGVTNSCSNGNKCNCYNSGSGWRADSGLLTDRSTLPVTQIRLGDLDDSFEEGYHTLGKLKCYGPAWWTCFATNTAHLSKGISFGPVLTFAQIISLKKWKVVRWSIKTYGNLDGILNKISSNFLKQNFFLKSVTKKGTFLIIG